jgi:hypothetical protein
MIKFIDCVLLIRSYSTLKIIPRVTPVEPFPNTVLSKSVALPKTKTSKTCGHFLKMHIFDNSTTIQTYSKIQTKKTQNNTIWRKLKPCNQTLLTKTS